jgi:hypothetical protein
MSTLRETLCPLLFWSFLVVLFVVLVAFVVSFWFFIFLWCFFIGFIFRLLVCVISMRCN